PCLHGGRPQLGGGLEPRDEPPVLGDVVGGDAEAFLPFGEHVPTVGVTYHRAVTRRPRLTAGPTVGFDDHRSTHSPDSGVRTRIASQFSHCTTSSSGAALISAMLLRSSSS